MAMYFLGGGNMASAIIGGLRAQSADDEIIVIEHNSEKHVVLQKQFSVKTQFDLPEHLSADDVLVLAVKPQDMREALAQVQTQGALVLSIAAGLTVATLANWLGTQRIVRVMPNTPAAVGLGVSGLFAGSGVSKADKALANRIMQACGITVWLDDEAMMNGITGVSGSGSAYVFYLMNALQTAACELGFDAVQARDLALQTFKGAVALAEQSGEDFEVLQDKVTSKGGTTFAALTTFEARGVAQGLVAGVHSATARSAELAELLK